MLPKQPLMLTANSGGGESANIQHLLLSSTKKLVTNSRFRLLPCKSQSRTVYNPLASHHWNKGSTKSVTDFQDPLTRTHHFPPPYCLSSLPRSCYNTTHTYTGFDIADWPTKGCSLHYLYSVHRSEAIWAEPNSNAYDKFQLNGKSSFDEHKHHP